MLVSSASATARVVGGRPVRGSDGNDHPLRDTLGDADARLDAVFEQAELDSLLHMLDERERTIVVLYFHGGMTQKEIGSRLGLSQMHISRLLREATDKLSATAAEQSELRLPVAA